MENEKQSKANGAGAQWRRTAGFLLVGAVLAIGLQKVLLFGLKHYREGNVGIMNRVALGEIRADIVISGSSRAAYHYDPRVIEAGTGLKTFNIGRDGTKLHEQLELLRVYLQRNPHPRYLLQNLDVMGLQENHDVTDGKQYMAWLGDDQIYQSLARQKRYYRLYRWVPLVGVCREGGMEAAVMGLFPDAGKGDGLNGYCPQNFAWNNDFEKFKSQRSSKWKEKIDPKKLQALSSLVEICKSNQVNIILVYSPDYSGSREFFENRDEIVKAFQDVAARFDVPLWDFSNDPMCADKAYFYNSQHMNATGAALFSRSLGQRLAGEISRAQAANADRKLDGNAQLSARGEGTVN